METTDKKGLDLDAVRQKLEGTGGAQYWRSLEELAETDEFKQWLDDEFPHRSSIPEIDRRSFLKFVGASLALAGLAGCRNMPQERIVPHVRAPEERKPGEAIYYATAMPFNGYGLGLLVESHEGRPTKIEGNPQHPASLGATDIYAQAEILTMYDPDRAQAITNRGVVSTWDEFLRAARAAMAAENAGGGAGIRILSEPTSSPTLIAQINRLLKRFPNAKWHQYDSANDDGVTAGARQAFGQDVQTVYDFSRARVVLSLDGDFLGCTPQTVRHMRDFASRRRTELGPGAAVRLYCVESGFSLTGAFADHRLPVKPSQVADVAFAIAGALGLGGGGAAAGLDQNWINSVAADLRSAGAGALVVAGEGQSPEVHALAHAMNAALGAAGSTVRYTAPVLGQPALKTESLRQLAADIQAGQVKTLIILGGNPVYTAPPDLNFADAVRKVKTSVRLGLYDDETSALCTWTVPEAHFLEAWGDVRAFDGTASIIQPLILPLQQDSRSAIEVVAALLGDATTGHDLVRATWRVQLGDDKAWQLALNTGVIPNTRSAPLALTPTAPTAPAANRGGGGIEAVFLPDPTVYDGRYANNGWLQELPKPMTKLTWDNAVIMSPRTAQRLGVKDEQNVAVSANGKSVTAPAFVLPGQPDDTLTLHLGYGRTMAGKVGTKTGFDFNVLRTAAQPGWGSVEVKRASGDYPLAFTQMHHSMEGRDIIREGDYEEFAQNPSLTPVGAHDGEYPILYNLTEEWSKSGTAQWAMTIDLNTCVGCNACVIACQAENNIPTVGKVEVQRGREMHWIRVDRYYRVETGGQRRDMNTGAAPAPSFEGLLQPGHSKAEKDADAMSPANVRAVFQPVTCMHCETAPCEPVCPVAATVHSHEGLNQMVYNRCVGTRYCSNNCPYKVRRFNYYNYQFGSKDIGLNKEYGNRNFQGDRDITMLRMLTNPDVTVRSRGVMEKCTYCVQRINAARIEAKKEGRPIRDGEVVPACSQACPTGSIIFGNLVDPNSKVAQTRKDKRTYGLLAELNTRPRTTYMGKVRNPNPQMRNA